MDAHTHEHQDYGFVVGLLAGTLVGVGLALWLAPRATAEIRQRVTDSTRDLGQRASERYRQATSGVADAVDDITRRSQDARDDAADAVARAAREVERMATAAKSDRGTQT